MTLLEKSRMLKVKVEDLFNMKYFRVYYGYDKDDFYSIPETDLRKAIIAQGTGNVAVFDVGTIAGNEIKRIQPDYQRLMGWNRDYKLGEEDYRRIGDKTRIDFEDTFLLTKTNVERELKGLPPLEQLE